MLSKMSHSIFLVISLAAFSAEAPLLVKQHCTGCHNTKNASRGLDLTTLSFDLNDRSTRDRWIRIHDRIQKREMPPKGVPLPDDQRAAMLTQLTTSLFAADHAEVIAHGRGPLRRLNRDEYEQNLRDILDLPHLDIRDMLPEDREAYHFNKVSETLDMSRVQLAAYLDATEAALRQSLEAMKEPPPVTTFHTFGTKLFPGARSTGEVESMFFIKDNRGINVAREKTERWTKEQKEDESIEMGLFRSPGWPYGAFPPGFATKYPGEYRVRFRARAVLQQPGFQVTPATQYVPMTFRSRRPTNHDIAEDTRNVGGIIEIQPEPAKIYETSVYLTAGQTIEYGLLGLFTPQVDAVPGKSGSYRFPPFPPGGAPGVAFNWLEIEGPFQRSAWPLFEGSTQTKEDASRLLRRFIKRAARRPIPEEAIRKFERLVFAHLDKNESFTEAMLAGYQAFLCSGLFLYLHEPDDHFAIAERLSHFLTNSRPDTELMQQAKSGKLRNPAVLRAEADRLIAAPTFDRFVNNFTDYWLNLRQIHRDDPDIRLYPEYRLNEYLVDSMDRETREFFTVMVRDNLPIDTLVDSDFAMINDTLAKHYHLAPVNGTAIRRVELPEGSHLGGILTQAAILKITANGTTTSPVLRGAWIMDRIMGDPPPPPPPGVPAVEPDIRGAKTIRDQLALHTKSATCASCHANFDPVGVALENFDVLGGWRAHYRGTAEGQRITGIDPSGHDFAYTIAANVDPSSRLANGQTFQDVRELKAIFAANPRQLARNLLNQFTIYATGTPVRFSDRTEIEKMLDACAPTGYRTRDLLYALVQNQIFLGGY